MDTFHDDSGSDGMYSISIVCQEIIDINTP